jgi:hypothetical protein
VVEAGEIQMHTAIPGLELAHFCRHNGPPHESRPLIRAGAPFSGPAVRGKQIWNVYGVSGVKSSK